MNSEIETVELQRLVEGRLPADEREALLAWADDHPENWKPIALAYVEEQALGQQLSTLATIKASTPPSRQQARWPRFVVASVALVAATFLGVVVGRFSITEAQSPLVANSASAPDYSDPTYVVLLPEASQTSFDAPGTLWDDAVEMMSTPLFDRELQDQLRSYGFTAVERPMLYMVADDAGSNYVIPQREVSLVSLVDETVNSDPLQQAPFSKEMP